MSLSVTTGPMFSGKTTTLIKKLTQHVDVQKKCRCAIINSFKDNRNLEHTISSHCSSYKGISEKINIFSLNTLSEFDYTKFDVIGVDEAQFFPDLYENVKNWVEHNKYVYVSGLDSDYLGENIGEIYKLLHISDKFVKLGTICAICSDLHENQNFNLENVSSATFTGKTNGTKNIIEIGSECYKPMCRIHHRESVRKWLEINN